MSHLRLAKDDIHKSVALPSDKTHEHKQKQQ